MDGTKEQTRRIDTDHDFIVSLLEQPTRELTVDEVDALEQQLHELEVIDDFLFRIAPELAVAEDY